MVCHCLTRDPLPREMKQVEMPDFLVTVAVAILADLPLETFLYRLRSALKTGVASNQAGPIRRDEHPALYWISVIIRNLWQSVLPVALTGVIVCAAFRLH